MRRTLVSTATLITLLLVWEAVYTLHLVPEVFLPGPWAVGKAFYATSPGIFQHAASTWVRAFVGFILGTVLGMLTGFLMHWSAWFRATLDPIVESIRPVPAIAALPFMILWFGTGNVGQLVLIALSCAAIVAVDVFIAVRNVSPAYIKVARSLGATRFAVFRTILLPAILPELIAGLRISATISFTVAIAAEFMGAQWGLGFLMMRARRTLETQTILLCSILVGVIARITDIGIRLIMERLTYWSDKSTGSLLTIPKKEPEV